MKCLPCFSPHHQSRDDRQKKALRKTSQHPLWAQKLRVLYPNLLGGCRTALRGCGPRAPPHRGASAPLPAVPIPALQW